MKTWGREEGEGEEGVKESEEGVVWGGGEGGRWGGGSGGRGREREKRGT